MRVPAYVYHEIKDKEAIIHELEQLLFDSKGAMEHFSRQEEIRRLRQEIQNLKARWNIQDRTVGQGR